ncbi:hypothetical protein CBM2586_B10238 [Cupriavidus phytorum]|uniref:Uncharacterized protein n=1 Tax=Cupriavidus taiwanensis TaxID=164546 RepID=A0A975XC78_9BURK|nr:hypothetical protein [Cupriavidus taiwanensis]SOY65643.1 hypothetical protein CBM2586_B10238 [Cupriavidus taiwanensis]
MNRFDPSNKHEDGMAPNVDGEWIRYSDHVEAMKRIAAAEMVASQSAEPVALDGHICEHCGEGHTVVTLAHGVFSSNCDMCSADCDYFMVERLNQLIAATGAKGLTSQRVEEIAKAYFHQDGTELGDMKTAIRVAVREALAQSAPAATAPSASPDSDDINPVELIGAEFQKCHAKEAHPRDVDVLLDALNCTLVEHGFKVVDLGDDDEPSASPETMVHYGGGETPISFEDGASPAALTDEQIFALWDEVHFQTSRLPIWANRYRQQTINFARALLAASPVAPISKGEMKCLKQSNVTLLPSVAPITSDKPNSEDASHCTFTGHANSTAGRGIHTEEGESQSYRTSDGMPKERAVLEREWRQMRDSLAAQPPAAAEADKEPDMLWAYDDPESPPSSTAQDFAETFASKGMMCGDESIVRVLCAKSMPDRRMLIRVSEDPDTKDWLHYEWIDATMERTGKEGE